MRGHAALLPLIEARYTAVSFCSGIGGLDLAFDRAGFEIKAQVEINEFCCKILEREWPGILRLHDMHECGAHNLPAADVFFGGIPCQPHSRAGKRKGDEDERNLWPTFRRIIGELRPRVVLLENVPGITSSFRGADGKRKPAYALTIVGELAAMGYDCEWGTLFASDAGAPHPRERWVLVAYANRERQLQPQGSIKNIGRRVDNGDQTLGNTYSVGMEGQRASRQQVMEARYSPFQPEGSGYGTWQQWANEPRLGRVLDGLSARVDRSRWPAPQGSFQYPWEPSRVASTKLPYRKERIEANGNAVVPQVFYWVARAILEWFQAQDALSSAGVVEEAA